MPCAAAKYNNINAEASFLKYLILAGKPNTALFRVTSTVFKMAVHMVLLHKQREKVASVIDFFIYRALGQIRFFNYMG